MKLIGFDFDDVLFDFSDCITQYARVHNPDYIQPNGWVNVPGGKDELKAYVDNVSINHTKDGRSKEDINEIFKLVTKIQSPKTPIHIITSRTDKSHVQVADWLTVNVKCKCQIDAHFVKSDLDKRSVIEKLGVNVFFDDSVKVIKSIQDICSAFLISTPFNQDVTDITRHESVLGVLETLYYTYEPIDR